MNLPPIPNEIFHLTLDERAAELQLEKCNDPDELRRVAIGMYRQGLRDSKLAKFLIQYIVSLDSLPPNSQHPSIEKWMPAAEEIMSQLSSQG